MACIKRQLFTCCFDVVVGIVIISRILNNPSHEYNVNLGYDIFFL